jgi:hypothetical protein
MVEKWKYGNLALNLTEIEENSESVLLYLNKQFEKTYKEDLINKIDSNFPIYKYYLHEIQLFYFKELNSKIKEATNCLIIEAFTACITLTNHILERTLKLALIQNELGLLPIEMKNWNQFKSTYDNYSSESMGKILNICKNDKKIINKAEYDELDQYKKKFRDGFSHFTPKKILKNEKSLRFAFHNSITKPPKVQELSLRKIPTNFQSLLVDEFSKKNAKGYLEFVLKVIRHLERTLSKKIKHKN